MAIPFKYCPFCKGFLLQEWIDGRYRYFCSRCKWVHYENPLPAAACAAVNRRGEMLLTRRNLEPGMGRWALPGGFIEVNESPQNACLRELKEEAGIEGVITGLIGVYSQKVKKYGNVLVLGYAMKVTKRKFRLSREVKEIKFFRPGAIPYIPFSTHRNIIKQVSKSGSQNRFQQRRVKPHLC